MAVIGSGIAGLSAAWLLSRSRPVTLFEEEAWIGGHSHTVDVAFADRTVPVDTGFIVYNEQNYPNLTALFAHLGVATRPATMSFSASVDGGRLEYGSASLNTLVGQRINLLRPRFWAMMRDLIRFYRTAGALVDSPEIEGVSLGDYLASGRYRASFVDDHILPLAAAIWSTAPHHIRDYPLRSFIRFFTSHRLLALGRRPEWRSVVGGSREYVARMSAALGGRVRAGAGARAIVRTPGGVLVRDANGREERFDEVVIATHADQALALLPDADEAEHRLLGAFHYTANRAVLHTDATLMPKRRRVWASWNFLGPECPPAPGGAAGPMSVTYWMNSLQSLQTPVPVFVSLNPGRAPHAAKVLGEFSYSHPCYDGAALEAQQQLWRIQGRRRTWFCGSYFGYGFHEVALQSGLAAAEALGGVRRPWQVAAESGRIALGPVLQEAAE